MRLWMKVSEDIYELPEAVCGSISELSFKTGIRVEKIENEYYYSQRVGKPCRFVRVDVDDWTENEKNEEKAFFLKERAKARKRSAIRHNWQKRYWVIQ